MFLQTFRDLMKKSKAFHNGERAVHAYANPSAVIVLSIDSVYSERESLRKINTDFLSNDAYNDEILAARAASQ